MTWTKEEIDFLELTLLRARAMALTERNAAQRLFGAYGESRSAIVDRIAYAEYTIEKVNALLPRIEELKL